MAVQITGLDSLMRKLDSMGGNVLDALDKAVRKLKQAKVARGDARQNAPVDTGRTQGQYIHRV